MGGKREGGSRGASMMGRNPAARFVENRAIKMLSLLCMTYHKMVMKTMKHGKEKPVH